jgi:hypothetical protein
MTAKEPSTGAGLLPIQGSGQLGSGFPGSATTEDWQSWKAVSPVRDAHFLRDRFGQVSYNAVSRKREHGRGLLLERRAVTDKNRPCPNRDLSLSSAQNFQTQKLRLLR